MPSANSEGPRTPTTLAGGLNGPRLRLFASQVSQRARLDLPAAAGRLEVRPRPSREEQNSIGRDWKDGVLQPI